MFLHGSQDSFDRLLSGRFMLDFRLLHSLSDHRQSDWVPSDDEVRDLEQLRPKNQSAFGYPRVLQVHHHLTYRQ